MDVPYISQLEADGSGYNNCGPACLTMALAYDGLMPTTREAMHTVADYIRDGVYDWDWWLGTYTDYPMMQYMLDREFRRGSRILSTWAKVHEALDAGRPTMVLVDNSVLQPRLYPATAGWNAHHFILLTGKDAAHYAVNDPLAYFHRGPSHYTRSSVEYGAALCGGVHALVLDAPAKKEFDLDQWIAVQLASRQAEFRSYVGQLGFPMNPSTAIFQRAFRSYILGETRGPAVSGEYPALTPDGVVSARLDFTAGTAEWRGDTNQVYWVEVNK